MVRGGFGEGVLTEFRMQQYKRQPSQRVVTLTIGSVCLQQQAGKLPIMENGDLTHQRM